MKKVYNLLLVFALVLAGGMLGLGKVNAEDDFYLNATGDEESAWLEWDEYYDEDEGYAQSYQIVAYTQNNNGEWVKNPNSLIINAYDDGEDSDYACNDGSDECSYHVTDMDYLKGGTSVNFQVLALDADAYSDGNVIGESVMSEAYIYKNVELNVTINGTDANLSWTKNDNIENYIIHYGEKGEQEQTVTTTATSYTLKDLTPNKEYTFWVESVIDEYDSLYGGTIIKKIESLNIAKASISGIKNKTYNGKAQTQNIVLKYNGNTLKEGTDYILGYGNNVNAGTAIITITGKNKFSESALTTTFKINKASNPMTVKAVNKKVKYKKVKKKKQKITPITASKAQGKVTYTKVSGNKKITVNKTTGKITVKKKTKKGTYYVKVKVNAAGNKNYKSATKTVTIKIRVK